MVAKTSSSKATKERLLSLKTEAARYLLTLVGPRLLTLARDKRRWEEMRLLVLKVPSTGKRGAPRN
jgi:hypothetical protein